MQFAFRRALVVLLGCTLGASLPAQIPITPVPPAESLDAAGIVELYGAPDFAFGNLLAYQRVFAGLPADISFLLVDGELEEITFGFAADAGDADRLRRDGDRILKRLRTMYGSPGSGTRERARYKTHLWSDERGTLVHTVVYTAGHEQHTIRVARRRAPS